MFRALLITILSIGAISTAYWGYREHQEKNAVLIRAENNYQRAFNDLTYEIDLLHDKNRCYSCYEHAYVTFSRSCRSMAAHFKCS
ncbi:hypothetical protein GCM10020331_062620 [Ectobacillus funiculus]